MPAWSKNSLELGRIHPLKFSFLGCQGCFNLSKDGLPVSLLLKFSVQSMVMLIVFGGYKSIKHGFIAAAIQRLKWVSIRRVTRKSTHIINDEDESSSLIANAHSHFETANLHNFH